MKSAATLITEAKAALAVADAADQQQIDATELASDSRWRAAECMAALDAGGMKQRDIAAAVGVSLATVQRYVTCWRSGIAVRKLTFTEAMKQVRGGWGNEPTTIEGKAKAVASYVADPQVFADPTVVAAVTSAQRQAIKAAQPPKPAAALPPPRGLLTAATAQRIDYWSKLFIQVETCRQALQAAVTEIGRTGLPEARSGQLVKELRQLSAVAQKTERLLSEQAIGKAM